MEEMSHSSNIAQILLLGLSIHCSVLLCLLVNRTHAIARFEQRHIMQMPDAESILKSRFTEYIGTCTVLKIPHACSYQTLDMCHLNEIDQDLYHQFCFIDVCEKDKYYCLNGNSHTLHVCGSVPKCRKRYRNIVVYDRTDEEIVNVYSVPCPDGYLQLSVANCFTPCIEDHSIVLIRGPSPDQNAFGYCNSEKNYCNRQYVNVFELSSDDDACKIVDTKCPGTEDLLPNCSCAVKCLPHQTRSWSNNFSCQQSVRVSSSPSTVKQTPSLTTSPRIRPSPSPSAISTVNQYSQSVQSISTVRHTGNSKHSQDTHISSSLFIGVGTAIIVMILVVLIVALVCIYRSRRDYQEVSQEKEQDSRDNEVSSGSRTVIIEKKKTIVKGNVIKFKSNCVHMATPEEESLQRNQAVVLDISDHDSENLNVKELGLENLKEHLSNEHDSGILSSEQTNFKEPYGSE